MTCLIVQYEFSQEQQKHVIADTSSTDVEVPILWDYHSYFRVITFPQCSDPLTLSPIFPWPWPLTSPEWPSSKWPWLRKVSVFISLQIQDYHLSSDNIKNRFYWHSCDRSVLCENILSFSLLDKYHWLVVWLKEFQNRIHGSEKQKQSLISRCGFIHWRKTETGKQKKKELKQMQRN